MYETLQEAQTRLSGTIFFYNGEPVYCEMVDGSPNDLHLLIHTLPRMVESKKVKLADPNVNYKQFKLGYINTQHGASFYSRMPARGRFKQGLYKDTASFSVVNAKTKPWRPDFASVWKTPAFRDMLVNKYPSVVEAIERLSTEEAPASVAFHRNFALAFDKFREDYILQYKGEDIAFGKEPNYNLSREFNYLREVLAANGIQVR